MMSGAALVSAYGLDCRYGVNENGQVWGRYLPHTICDYFGLPGLSIRQTSTELGW